MKQIKLSILGVCIFSGLFMIGCNSNGRSSNQPIDEKQYANENEQYTNENEQYTNENEQYTNEEDVGSQYILMPKTLYKGMMNGGFDPLTDSLTTDKKHNETSFKIKTYKDGGVTFSFDNKVYVKGWGFNMSGELEGNWKDNSFSYHDVEYNFIEINCKEEIYPTYYEDSNHTPTDYKHIETLYVKMLVDKDLNFYFSDNDLKNHNPAGKLARE